MARRIGLGRGLSALLDNNDDDSQAEAQTTAQASFTPPPPQHILSPSAKGHDIVQMPVDKLVPNPGQPRKHFDETELKELADSIKTYGIIQPIIAARSESGDASDAHYIIIAGERRTRAARIAGLKTVPVIVRDYTDQKRLEVSLIENIQRTDLNPIEEAVAYKNLMDFSNFSQDEMAFRVGKNRSTIANALRLLKLPVEIQKSIEEGKLSPGPARALLSVTDAKARDKLYKEMLAADLSVRDAEKKASALNTGAPGAKKPSAKGAAGGKRPPEIDAMTEKFIGRLGTKVVIEGDMNKGRIHIEYYSMEDLERLYEILGG
jgi:ParB family chromosome partitioning protein